ncbi:MAG: glycosyltransferase family 2 protein [Chitinophagaceae bacterium]
MIILKTIFYFLQVWIAIYLLLPLFFLLVYWIKKGLRRQYTIAHKRPVIEKDFDFAAIITAHKDLTLIPPLVDSFCRQTYRNFTVYVVADACDISGLHFEDERVIILKPEKELGAKIRSIDYAINHFVRPHEVLVIFDSDNLVHPEYMHVLNLYYQQGFRAVQTNLQAKNKDNLYSRLDTIGNTFYNFTEREMRMELGLSSAIWGLGISLETSLYKEIIYQHFLGGFDKRIQADIVRKIPQLAFAKEAIVYDEKITDAAAMERQRTRWIHAQFKYFNLGWEVLVAGIRKLNFNVAFFGFMNLRPPLFLVMGMAFLFVLINLFINPLSALIWSAVIVVFVISFFLIISAKTNDKKLLSTVFYMPLFILRQVFALLKMGKANKSFLKTEHTKIVFIEDLLKNEPV